METLQEKCINVLSRNFYERPIACATSQLKPQLLQQIHERLNPDLDPFVLARHVVSERYWRKRLEQQQQQQQQQHASVLSTAKSLALQAALQQVIEADDAEKIERIELDVIVEHIFALRLTKVPLSIDLSKTLACLNNLTFLEIELGPDGMSDEEAMALGRALPSVKYLTNLSMRNCCLSDDSIRAMKDGMKSSSTGSTSSRLPPGLISLDVSDNRISAGGLGLLFDMLSPYEEESSNTRSCVLSSFIAANNCIDEEGGRFLATDVLPVCTSLTHLNVKVNQLGDVGGQMILGALQEQTRKIGSSGESFQLQQVNLAGNGLASKTAESLAQLLRENDIASLSSINISLNNLSSENIASILSAIQGNAGRRGASILHLDLQESNSRLGETTGRIDVAKMERGCGVRVYL